MSIVVYKSNRLEKLFTSLKDQLYFTGSTPLATRSLVVPSPAMRWWVQLQLAEQCGVCAGLEWLYLDEIPDRFFEKGSAPSTAQHSFAIEQWLRLNHPVSEHRLPLLSDQLSGLFKRYGLFGRQMVAEWKADAEEWQQQLWHALGRVWENSGEVWLRKPKQETGGALHLFGVSFFTLAQLEGLERLAERFPVFLYQLSPTPYFWGDVASDRESEKLQLKCERQGNSQAIRENLEALLLDRNRLLGNWGRVGREFSNHLVDLEIEPEETFAIPEEQTLLSAIQRDLLVMRNPRDEPPLSLPEGDCSVELHCSSSPLREVENLHDRLMHLVHTKGMRSCDVVVMAPDITPYAPYLKMVFGEGEGGLTLRMLDLPLQTESVVVYGFKILIELATSRWESTTLLELLACEPFREALGIDLQQVNDLKRWMEQFAIRWGFDGRHRKEVLRSSTLEKADQGTWSFGLDCLIDQQLSGGEEALDSRGLGEMIEALHMLRSDLAPLASETQRPLCDWVDYLHSLLDTYFVAETDPGCGKLHALFERLRVELPFGDAIFPFSSVRERLLGAIARESCGWREWAADGVRCCSLLPMRAVPAEVVCLLGLSDRAYPRTERKNSHDLLHGAPKEYDPDRNDFDRYLFLEALLSARSYLLINYSTASSDGGEQGPSLLLRELFDYCDGAFRIGEHTPSEACIYNHPASPFSTRYFEKSSPIPSYAHHRYRGAKMRLAKEFSSYRLINDWLTPGAIEKGSGRFDLADLTAVARHPLRYYLQKGLKLYLNDTKEVESHDSFSLSPLQQALLCREALRSSTEKAIGSAEQRGLLPVGPFRTVALARLNEQITAQQALIAEAELFTVELRGDCVEPIREKDRWILPSLKLGKSEIVGVMRDVSSKGVLLTGKKPQQAVMRLWPTVLVQNLLAYRANSPFAEESKKLSLNACESYLEKFLDYALAAERAPSPLFPEWIAEIESGSVERFSATYESMRQRYDDPYLDWAFATETPPFESIIKEWSSDVGGFFGGVDAFL